MKMPTWIASGPGSVWRCGSAGVSASGLAGSGVAMFFSLGPRRHRRRVPIVPLLATVAAPGVEGVIDGHPVLQHRVIVGVDNRKAQRHGQQTRRLRCQLEPRRIGATDDQREHVERRILDAVLLQEGVETTQLAIMRKRLGPGDIVRRGPGVGRDGEDALGWREHEPRLAVDEPPDQPGAGDAVYFGPLAGDPSVRTCFERTAARQPELGPTLHTMFEVTGVAPDSA